MKKRIVLELKKIDRFLRRSNIKLKCNKEAEFMYKNSAESLDLNHPSIAEAIKYWRKYNIRLNPRWHAFCASLNNIRSSRYVPADIFYNHIIPSLNNNNLAAAYDDKNTYDVFMKGINMPRTVLRCMHGYLHDADYNLLTDVNYSDCLPCKEANYLIKPTIDSGSGKNIKLCKIRDGVISIDGKPQDMNELKFLYKGDFIIQEVIDQSLTLSDIYPYSVNTIRSLSLRHENKIVILSNMLKFGNNKNCVDNTGLGGVVCGVDGNGNVAEFGYNLKFDKMHEHPFTRKPFKNIILPNIGNLEKLVIQCHKRLPHFDFVAWDIAVDKSKEYVLVEYNVSFPGIYCPQVIDGPIFEKYLDGILDNLHTPEDK